MRVGVGDGGVREEHLLDLARFVSCLVPLDIKREQDPFHQHAIDTNASISDIIYTPVV